MICNYLDSYFVLFYDIEWCIIHEELLIHLSTIKLEDITPMETSGKVITCKGKKLSFLLNETGHSNIMIKEFSVRRVILIEIGLCVKLLWHEVPESL